MMNTRIRELAEQANLQAYYDAQEAHIKRFAELIVRECAKVSERTGSLNEADYEGEMIADAIKEHFGIEE
jgi:hypothetical protein